MRPYYQLSQKQSSYLCASPKNRSLIVTYDLRHGALLKPGHFTGRFEVRDKATNKSASKDIAMSFGDDEFAFGAFAFYGDEEARLRLAPNLTVGDKIKMRQVVLLPKKSYTNDIELTVSVLDAGGHAISRTVTKREEWLKYALDPSEYAVVSKGLVVNRPGSFRLRYELKDLVTKETITREIPFNAFPPPELPAKGP